MGSGGKLGGNGFADEAVRSGRAAGEPWKSYDLGHGYCVYEFFEQCPYRMACAKCDFYMPKESSRARLLEAKENLLKLRQDIPLDDDEIAAVEDGVTAYERLLARLVDRPTPAGPSLRQMEDAALVQITIHDSHGIASAEAPDE